MQEFKKENQSLELYVGERNINNSLRLKIELHIKLKNTTSLMYTYIYL